MLVTEKIGNLETFPLQGRTIDWLWLEWFESNKRILHKRTGSGAEITLRFLDNNPQFYPGDVLYADNNTVVAIEIIETDVIVIKPQTMREMAATCYEIGNKHLPLFYQGDEIIVAFEKNLFTFLEASGYKVEKANRKLINPLKTTVAPHGNSSSLFSRIMKLTTDPS
jgi:urease accessory protein